MAKAKKSSGSEQREAAPGTKKVMYTVGARHVQALRAEAIKRAEERGSGRLDASEVLREILDAWMAKR